MRQAEIIRSTKETEIKISLTLDAKGDFTGSSGCGFLDHMLELMSRHGRFDLYVEGSGDTQVDFHHLVEDTGIVLGQAFRKALGDMGGVTRYGNFLLPMDETLVMVAVDISGRPTLGYALSLLATRIGDFDTELVEEFFLGFVRGLGATLHLQQMAGHNTHHIIEAAFKGVGRALAEAVTIDTRFKDEIPSTKGKLF